MPRLQNLRLSMAVSAAIDEKFSVRSEEEI